MQYIAYLLLLLDSTGLESLLLAHTSGTPSHLPLCHVSQVDVSECQARCVSYSTQHIA